METVKTNNVHFIGIGGIGISGLARLYLHEGWAVSGTNDNPSPQTLDALRGAGVEISLDETLLPEADLYVYSDSWLSLNPALIEKARATGKPTQSYFEAVAAVANEYYLIAVAGTHGKTTTTAMLIDILEEASFDPTAIVGSLRTKTSSNFRAGKSKYFIIEADEFMRHFLHFTPDVLVITNIDYDHVDCFKDLAEVQAAFRELAMKVPDSGAVVAAVKDLAVATVLADLTANVLDYQEAFDLELQLPQPGVHNQLNAAAARRTAQFLGIKEVFSKEALENFAGTKRRFEYKGDVNNAPVYDDYAHHPSEILATIAGAREKYPTRQLTIVFQPHTYSRTKELRADFVKALAKGDRVLLLPIYAARETADDSITSEMLAADLQALGDVRVEHFYTREAAAQAIKDSVSGSDVVLVLGAGDVTEVATFLTA